MGKIFVFDAAKCNGCHCCQVACKDEHCDMAWPPYAQAQPDTGQFWMKVSEKVRGQVPKVCVSYSVHGCMHCSNAPCMAVAKDNAVYRRDDGLVIIDPEKAVGQKQIVEACPYEAVFWNEELSLPQKCTGCAHLLDDGWSIPRCVEACPTEALRFGAREDFADELADAVVLDAKPGTGPDPDLNADLNPEPNFYYLNLPKRFIGGEVYDQEADEVLIGAQITLSKDGEIVGVTESDDFGDFWFKQIEPALYTVSLEMEGYMTRSKEADVTEEDLNIGSIALYETLD